MEKTWKKHAETSMEFQLLDYRSTEFILYPIGNHRMFTIAWIDGPRGNFQVLDMNRLGEFKFLFEYPRLWGGYGRGVKGQKNLSWWVLLMSGSFC